ncbi:MAG: ABC transporter permease [Candidatus Bathyarchaeia archaeon]|jgi:ABC-type antimicrobial peptide transport system permease subunit
MYPPYVFKELSRRKTRTTTNFLTIATIVALLLLANSILAAYSSAIYLPFRNTGSDMIVYLSDNAAKTSESKITTPFGKGIFSIKQVMDISSLKHVQDISKSLVLWYFGREGFVSMEGIGSSSFLGEKLSSWVNAGNFITQNDSGQVDVEYHFANFHHLRVGDNVTVGDATFTVKGVIRTKDESNLLASNIYLTLPEAQRLGSVEGYNQLYLKIDDLSNEQLVKSEILQIDDRAVAMSGSSISASLGNLAKAYDDFQWIGLGLMTLIAGLVLFKVNAAVLLERRRDIAVLRSVGWTKKEITGQIVSEVLLQVILGFIVGVLTSIALTVILGSVSVEIPSVSLEKPAPVTLPLFLSPITTLNYFAAIIITCILVSYVLARNILAIKPSENLRSL